MKYILLYNEGIGEQCIPFLEKEITRNDIRAEIYSMEGKVGRKTIREIKPDFILLAGIRPFRWIKSLNGMKVGYLMLDINPTNRLLNKLKTFDIVFSTLPNQDQLLKQKGIIWEYIGNPHIDLLRHHEFAENFSLGSDRQRVVILPDWGKPNSAKSLKSRLEKTSSNVQFIIPEEQSAIFDVLKHCNAAIAMSPEGSLQALLSNCPQVCIEKNALINELAKSIIVKELLKNPSHIMDEINLILNDHQYAATMLQGYQEVRELIGMEPSFRKIGGLIVESLEEEG